MSLAAKRALSDAAEATDADDDSSGSGDEGSGDEGSGCITTQHTEET